MRKIQVLLLLAMTAFTHGCHKSAITKLPLIGITSVYETGRDGKSASTVVAFAYVQAVLESGGTPLVLPTIQNEEALGQYLEILDGLVLVGGADIPPSAYGQKPHETVQVMATQRYNFENRKAGAWDLHRYAVYQCCCRGFDDTGYTVSDWDRRCTSGSAGASQCERRGRIDAGRCSWGG